MDIFFIFLLCGIISAVIALNKGRSGFVWFIFGFLFGPLGLILAVVNSKKKKAVVDQSAINSFVAVPASGVQTGNKPTLPLMRRFRPIRAVFAIAILMIFSSAITSNILDYLSDKGDITEKPKYENQRLDIKPQESTIALSIKANLINLKIKDKFPASEHHIRGETRGVRYWGIIKNSSPTIVGRDDRIDFTILCSGSMNFKWKIVQETTRINLIAYAHARPTVDENWNLIPNFNADYRWDPKPEVMGVTINELLDPHVRRELESQIRNVEKEIKKNLDLKKRALIGWDKLHSPIKISQNPEGWLQIIPKEINLSGLTIQNDILNASVYLKVNTEASIGVKPRAVQKTFLPKLNSKVTKNKNFSIMLPVTIDYTTMIKETEKVLSIGEKWWKVEDIPDTYVLIEEANIYPSKDNLVIGLKLKADLPGTWFDTKGMVYLSGKPVIDNNQRVLRIENMDFTRVTDNKLVNILSLVFKSKIKDELSKSLIFNLESQYKTLHGKVNKEINRDFGGGLKSTGSLSYFKVDEIRMLESGVHISTIWEGNLQLNIGL